MGSKEIINTSIGFEEYRIPNINRSLGKVALSAVAAEKITQFQAKHNL
ncbi:MAG: hypothetical protein K6G36_00770 [Candidatus Saccharibacteria bacterium]|nr:hypothetical protein [Candidatus Saccharibacteria bacterium]